uniref:DUF7920 domain-containing protein n=1 Tax=Spongospora subterranea TaxID=70186 RepID=A0A0H5QWP3_9EUKA|eukprot:CRZ06330.1 hypothetical protein [Spongospora subterranea]
MVLQGMRKFEEFEDSSLGAYDAARLKNRPTSQWESFFLGARAALSPTTKFVFTDKENGEVGHLAVLSFDNDFVLIVGSKNVHMAIRQRSDIASYETQSVYRFACRVAHAMMDQLSRIDRYPFLEYLSSNCVTANFELIDPTSQHIVLYDADIHLRFFAWTCPITIHGDFPSFHQDAFLHSTYQNHSPSLIPNQTGDKWCWASLSTASPHIDPVKMVNCVQVSRCVCWPASSPSAGRDCDRCGSCNEPIDTQPLKQTSHATEGTLNGVSVNTEVPQITSPAISLRCSLCDAVLPSDGVCVNVFPHNILCYSASRGIALAKRFGLRTVEAQTVSYEELDSALCLAKARTNSEGAVVYCETDDGRTIGLWKVKSIWYMMHKAIRTEILAWNIGGIASSVKRIGRGQSCDVQDWIAFGEKMSRWVKHQLQEKRFATLDDIRAEYASQILACRNQEPFLIEQKRVMNYVIMFAFCPSPDLIDLLQVKLKDFVINTDVLTAENVRKRLFLEDTSMVIFTNPIMARSVKSVIRVLTSNGGGLVRGVIVFQHDHDSIDDAITAESVSIHNDTKVIINSSNDIHYQMGMIMAKFALNPDTFSFCAHSFRLPKRCSKK